MAPKSLSLGRFSLGIGDRFGLEAPAQLRALQMALEKGVAVTPVWNKSNREHTIIGTEPLTVRAAADAAVSKAGWTLPHFVDADHIGLKTVDRFMAASDFFTIDVADAIGTPASDADVDQWVAAIRPTLGTAAHPDLDEDLNVTPEQLRTFGKKYSAAIKEAGAIYRYIVKAKGEKPFITEVSVDEASDPQRPYELYLFLAGLAREGVRINTVAPKFTGQFLKGIDYVGDIGAFTREFKNDVAVLAVAVKQFGLPADLKLSVHSGSDKFSLYPIIAKAVRHANAGLHLKTAGTTWLEEVIGLAKSPKGLDIAKRIYRGAFDRYDELQKPYATVIDIDRAKLPSPSTVDGWSSADYVAALEHDQKNPKYSIHVRQLVHIAFRIAAEMGEEYRQALIDNRRIIEEGVTHNLFERHVRPLFLGQ